MSSKDDISGAKKWMLEQFRKDQKDFPSDVILMDVEEAKVTRYVKLRILGARPILEKTKPVESILLSQNNSSISPCQTEKD